MAGATGLIDNEIHKLFQRTIQIVSVSDIRSSASELRELSKLVIDDICVKVNGIVSDLQVNVTVDSSGEMKRKFTVVEQVSSTDDQDAKVRKTEGTPETGTDASASEDAGDGWTCASCTFVNHPSLESCEMCDVSRNAFALLQKQLEDLKQKTSLVDPPSHWLAIDPKTRLRRVRLAEDDVNYLEISKTMLAHGFQTPCSFFSLNGIKRLLRAMTQSTTSYYDIKKIERNENIHLYRMYSIQKEQMKQENGPLVQNEQMLWHGTSPESVDSIASYGFNRSHCGKNGTAFGKGVYFSSAPCYSSNPIFAKPDKSGLQYMFYSRVLTGRHTIGYDSMVEPPMYLNKLGRFNSLVDNMDSPSMYVIFHDAQAYPEFLVTFTSSK